MTITMSHCLGKDIRAIVELQSAGDAFTKSLNDTIVVSPPCRSSILNFGKGEANRGLDKIETYVTELVKLVSYQLIAIVVAYNFIAEQVSSHRGNFTSNGSGFSVPPDLVVSFLK